MKIGLSPSVRDWYADGDAGVVLVGDEVLMLSPLASCVITALVETQTMSLEDLAALLSQRFGLPSDGSPKSACESLLHEMEHRQLVVTIGA